MTSGAVLGGASAVAAFGCVSRSSQLFGPSVFHGCQNRRSIALTFDDGPSEQTLDLLEYLDCERITATFFVCGMNVQRLPRIAGEIAAAGHQIGNHSYSHPSLLLKSKRFIEREFTDAQRVIVGELGIVPMVLRPPYGIRWVGLREVQSKLSLLGVLWTVIGYDWRLPSDRIAGHVLDHAAPGGIICLHDGRGVNINPDISESIKAVKLIVPILKDQGYAFETVSDLITPECESAFAGTTVV
ncbi:MAG TPA: polysaccharide deacetylase family protein [Bryobacteraceae bacterium]|nr:polysaccharide deacetylase family protein [Bryobacteraceae bacterium]